VAIDVCWFVEVSAVLAGNLVKSQNQEINGRPSFQFVAMTATSDRAKSMNFCQPRREKKNWSKSSSQEHYFESH
jgi:hypothetical protein